jgi:hypothetical protein
MEQRKDPNSLWRPVFEATVLQSPLLVSQQDLQRLKGTFLFEHAKDMRIESKQEAKDLLTMLKKLKIRQEDIFTIENYLWAKVFVETRAKRVLVEGRPLLCVFPLAILPKHSSQAHCMPILDSKRQTVDFVAGNHFEAGAIWHQSLESDAQQLFVYYGEASAEAAVSFSVMGEQEDPEAQLLRTQLANQAGIPDLHYLVSTSTSTSTTQTSHVIPAKALAAARISTMEQAELDLFFGSLEGGSVLPAERVFEKISDDNEAAALELLQGSLGAYMEQLDQGTPHPQNDATWLLYREYQRAKLLPLHCELQRLVPVVQEVDQAQENEQESVAEP